MLAHYSHQTQTVLKVTHLMDADLLLDIFSTLFSLRGIDHLHRNCLFCLSVHQQPHSETKDTRWIKR